MNLWVLLMGYAFKPMIMKYERILVICFLSVAICICCNDPEQQKLTKAAKSENALEHALRNGSENYIRAWNENDHLLMNRITITDFERTENGEVRSTNQAELAKAMEYWHKAMPDFQITLKETVIKDGKTYSFWIGTGTNTGKFGDNQPTGKTFKLEGFTTLAFNEDGKIIKEKAFFNMLGLLQDWGYTLSPPIME